MVDRTLAPSRWRGRTWLMLCIAPLLVLAATMSLSGSRRAAPSAAAPTSPRQLLLAVDGLSWEAFAHARSLGLFRRFATAGRLIAPYPSMSHPSWTEVMGTRRLFGARGNVRTVEARWFDLEAMRVHDDPREVIARQAGPFNYMRAFDSYFDPLIEPLMYFPGRRLFDRELEEAERDIVQQFRGRHFAAYISGSDALAHTHLDSLYPYLAHLDATLGRIVDSVRARDSTTQVWLVSDHGNAGGFVEGQRERYLTPVSMRAAARRAGLVYRDSGTVVADTEVAVVTIALASMINAYFPDLSRRRAFAQAALEERGVSLVTWLEVDSTDRRIVILTRDGEAELRWSGDSTTYFPRRGNPLDIPAAHWSSATSVRWMSDTVARSATVHGRWPDAPRRLVASAEKLVENAPDLIVNLEDGYCADGDFGRVVRMVRTHGSLSARSTLGVIAGTDGAHPVPAFVRAEEAMTVMRIDERALFSRVLATHAPEESPTSRHAIQRGTTGRIATGRTDYSVDAEFLRRAQPIVQSIGYFPWNTLRELASLLSELVGGQRTGPSLETLRTADPLLALTEGVDPLLALADSLQSGGTSDIGGTGRRLAHVARARKGLAPLAELLDAWSAKTARAAPAGDRAAPPIDALVAARQATMLAWTVPAFLDAALAAPESDSIDDPRDLAFASGWRREGQADFRHRPERLLWDSPLPSRLFGEVFTERRLLRSAGAGAFALQYTAIPDDVTVVLLPGIYTELFDDEIWQRGMRALRDNLGLRTLTVPLDGRCDADLNAAQLRQTLRDDTRRRVARGYATPRYLLIGYSKGGVDATHFLLADSALAERQIAALVTIASPHGGSPVTERIDLPAVASQRATRRAMPATCATRTASSSITPQARSAFWADHGTAVALRTRLFSLSLVSTMEEAHPWMKITKRIGEFTEANDGVVTRTASRFPVGVPAVDLGAWPGDHIAARRASTFPQEAFLESIVVTLAELGALDRALDARARETRRAFLVRHERMALAHGAGALARHFASDLRSAEPLPGGSSGWTPTTTFRTFGDPVGGGQRIRRITPGVAPRGLAIRCDQRSMLAFRTEYEFAYDAGNGGREDALDDGFSIVADSGAASGRACRLATRRSAIKMTTASLRFRPADFPHFSTRVRVAENVDGVDPTAARRGANDAAFKVWFVLRDVVAVAAGESESRATRLFGYTWNARDNTGRAYPDGAFVEAVSSRRSVVIRTLPEAWLVTIGEVGAREWRLIDRNLALDIARAFPAVPVDNLEVVAITIQSDSDESKGRSLSFLDYVKLTPSGHVARRTVP